MIFNHTNQSINGNRADQNNGTTTGNSGFRATGGNGSLSFRPKNQPVTNSYQAAMVPDQPSNIGGHNYYSPRV